MSKMNRQPIILAGDLNCQPRTLEIFILKFLVPEFSDIWLEIYNNASFNTIDVQNVNDTGFTCQCYNNTYTKKTNPCGERIDYIFSDLRGLSSKTICCKDSSNRFSLSDHCALSAELSLKKSNEEMSNKVDLNDRRIWNTWGLEALKICKTILALGQGNIRARIHSFILWFVFLLILIFVFLRKNIISINWIWNWNDFNNINNDNISSRSSVDLSHMYFIIFYGLVMVMSIFMLFVAVLVEWPQINALKEFENKIEHIIQNREKS